MRDKSPDVLADDRGFYTFANIATCREAHVEDRIHSAAWRKEESRGEQSLVLDAMDDQLLYEPTTATRNRKRMDEDKELFVAPRELRVQDLRVYYAVEEAEHKALIVVVAIGRKDRARVKLGKRWMEP